MLEGKITRNSKIRVVRDGIVITEDEIARCAASRTTSRKWPRATSAASALEKFSDIKEGDIFEAYILEEYRD